MRMLSPGLTLSALSFAVTLRGPRLAGRLTVQLPLTLIRLLGWHVGQRLKVQASKQGVTLSVRRLSSIFGARCHANEGLSTRSVSSGVGSRRYGLCCGSRISGAG